jgi:hypothetical protein
MPFDMAPREVQCDCWVSDRVPDLAAHLHLALLDLDLGSSMAVARTRPSTQSRARDYHYLTIWSNKLGQTRAGWTQRMTSGSTASIWGILKGGVLLVAGICLIRL